jgi:flagellar hook assembly protein FlgD
VRLTVFDAQGRAVRELARGEWAAGEHAVAWDGSDRSGRRVGAGVYVARLSVAGDERVRRFVVVP